MLQMRCAKRYFATEYNHSKQICNHEPMFIFSMSYSRHHLRSDRRWMAR